MFYLNLTFFPKFFVRTDFCVVVLPEENVVIPQSNCNLCRRIYALIKNTFPDIMLS